MFNISSKSNMSGLDKLQENLTTTLEAKIGIFDPKQATIGRVQEFGNPDNRFLNTPAGRPAPIPARPFVRPSIEGKNTITSHLKAVSKKFQTNPEKVNSKDTLVELSKSVMEAMQSNVIDKEVPPNARSTIKKKGFNDPLIDTGKMFDAITWKISRLGE